MVEAAYIHVPFCRHKCGYCDFASYAGKDRLIPAWYESLRRELQVTSQWSKSIYLPGEGLASVFFGGGTPTLVPADTIAGILQELRQLYGLRTDAEITIEANPGTVDPQYLKRLAAAGVNRISFGLQAAQDRLLHTLERIHSADDFVKSVEHAEAAGIKRISADIMLGLPGQTLKDVHETLDLILSLPIEHVSYYSLIIEPGTPFWDYYGNHPELLPAEDLERAMYHQTMRRLSSAGLFPYEISNAARVDAQCRHNLVYWQAKPYYGFGPAAHSYLSDVRRGNTADLNQYIEIWQSACEPFASVVEEEQISQEESLKEFMLLGLRLINGVSFRQFTSRYQLDLRDVFSKQLQKLNDRGLIVVTDESVFLSETGLDLANQVFMEFV